MKERAEGIGASGNVREEAWHGRGMVAFPVPHWHVVSAVVTHYCVGKYPLLNIVLLLILPIK